jgi:hypothetical protein
MRMPDDDGDVEAVGRERMSSAVHWSRKVVAQQQVLGG